MSSLKSLSMPTLVFSSSPTRSAQSTIHVTSVQRIGEKAKWQANVYMRIQMHIYVFFFSELGQVEHEAAFNLQGNQLNLIFRF